MSPEEDEDMNPESHDTEKGTGTAINAAEISDQIPARPMLINPKSNLFFRKAKATEDIVIQNQDVADLFDEMLGIDEVYE